MPKARRVKVKSTRGAAKPSAKPAKKKSSNCEDGGEIKSTSSRSVDSSVRTAPAGESLEQIASDTAHRLVRSLKTLLERRVASCPANYAKDAAWMEKYMRNQFKFFGFKAGERRALMKEWTKAESASSLLKNRSTLISFLKLAWRQEERDIQACGCDLAKDHRNTLLGDTDEEFDEGIRCVEELITAKSWWDTVDLISYQGELGVDLHVRFARMISMPKEPLKVVGTFN